VHITLAVLETSVIIGVLVAKCWKGGCVHQGQYLIVATPLFPNLVTVGLQVRVEPAAAGGERSPMVVW
jgi:hypothetical protein